MPDVRPSPIAGTWYPGDPNILSQTIDRQLKDCKIDTIPGTVIGVVSPHAGLRYSGHVAAYAFRSLEGTQPEIVAVLSPMHRPHTAKVITTEHDAFSTPLGEVEIRRDILGLFEDELTSTWGLKLDRVRYDDEHSIEIQLPFLQRVLHQPWRLLPIMVRDQSHPISEAIGRSLAAVLTDSSFVIVASTDLSHQYSQQVAERFDREILSRLEDFDPARLLAAEEEGTGFACGRGAMAAALWAAEGLGADHVKVLKYATSGEVTGDYSSVVGYGSAAIYRHTEE